MVKLKICGNATLSDIIELSKLNVDYIGIITDAISQRFVKSEFLTFVRRYTEKPIVNVKVNILMSEMEKELSISDYLQIHRVLDDLELELLKSYDFRKRIILYVPASFEYKKYLEKAMDTVDMVLIDSVKKGVGVDYKVASSFLKDYPHLGVGGKISIDNISNFIDLNPAWLDISSSIEIYPGKKDINIVKKIVEMVKYGSSSDK
ncbi:phosphoribosylanthranilate isomerase [Saccharolobus islandicus]|uniref:N-(5'-phosphoribosyl)anthranilate isomerase n=1 Tax=Saccharolobus islandicus LAL14/1 TaxID=1241935 RepID=M9U943_SACIS|nr:phosphoribosylanthranilate isomerase [Sulfolobus islandicus]AGJ62637.1 Phosphoribosylanthranilate isomerase [Sulfolobus islandicus LAL14/1]